MNGRVAVPAPADKAAERYPVSAEHTPAEHAADAAASDVLRARPARVPWSFADVATRAPEARAAAPIPGAGEPLPAAARAEMSGRFGEDFSGVRVHAGPGAAAAARAVDAAAYSVGEHVVLGEGAPDAAAPRARRLVAHELAHVVQARRSPAHAQAAHRQKAQQPGASDMGEFVDEAATYLESAASHYRTMAASRRLDQARAAQQPPAPAPAAAPKKGAAQQPAQKPTGKDAAATAPVTGLSAGGLATALKKLEGVYEGGRTTLEQNLPDDAARAARLRTAYVAAASGARAAAVDQTRVNLVIIAAPKEKRDGFIANATTYARIYYGKGQHGETVQTITDVDSVPQLFTEIQNAQPDRLIGRVDIFGHGTIEPTHQLKLGKAWHRVGDFSQEAQARAGDAKTLATQSRFDGSTVIELHACRLGADDSKPGRSGEAVTHGTDFAKGFGEAIGGDQGQAIIAYKEWWVPRMFSLGIRSPRQLTGRMRARFEKESVAIWDAAMAGGTEARALMTEAERAAGTVTRDRKIAIMEKLYDDAGGAWLIGHQYNSGTPMSRNPVQDVKARRDTFSNEADWQSLTLTVKAPAPAVTP
jgi:hypothetical protein